MFAKRQGKCSRALAGPSPPELSPWHRHKALQALQDSPDRSPPVFHQPQQALRSLLLQQCRRRRNQALHCSPPVPPPPRAHQVLQASRPPRPSADSASGARRRLLFPHDRASRTSSLLEASTIHSVCSTFPTISSTDTHIAEGITSTPMRAREIVRRAHDQRVSGSDCQMQRSTAQHCFYRDCVM